jgi:hypothetical protein
MTATRALTSDPLELVRAVFEDAHTVRQRQSQVLRRLILVSLVALLSLFFVSMGYDWHFDRVWRYETAGMLGATVGTAELLSRYRDAPMFVLLSLPGIGYVLINAAASLAAMGLILSFGWKFGAHDDAAAATQVLVAGLGAMAVFRSSLLTVKAGSDDVGIGPSSVLSIMMAASDRSADRLRAADRAGRVRDIMADVSYAKAKEALPTVAVALMQNLSPSDVAALNIDLGDLEGKKLPDPTKSFLLGLKITNVVSTAVLGASKQSLGASILVDAEPAPEAPATPRPPHPADVRPDVSEREPFTSSGLPQTPQTPDTVPVATTI